MAAFRYFSAPCTFHRAGSITTRPDAETNRFWLVPDPSRPVCEPVTSKAMRWPCGSDSTTRNTHFSSTRGFSQSIRLMAGHQTPGALLGRVE